MDDGVNYKADLQRDLKYIQARRKTVFFDKTVYFSKEPSINSEVLRRIDEKIGYLYEGKILEYFLKVWKRTLKII